MVKLKGPLLSESAHGSIAKAITYSKRRTTNQVRRQRAQKDKMTPGREIQRSYFQKAATWWLQLTSDEKLAWKEVSNSG